MGYTSVREYVGGRLDREAAVLELKSGAGSGAAS